MNYIDVEYSHQWIFITDTVDAVYRPDQWSPAAMLDRLAEIVGELPGEVSLLLSEREYVLIHRIIGK